MLGGRRRDADTNRRELSKPKNRYRKRRARDGNTWGEKKRNEGRAFCCGEGLSSTGFFEVSNAVSRRVESHRSLAANGQIDVERLRLRTVSVAKSTGDAGPPSKRVIEGTHREEWDC